MKLQCQIEIINRLLTATNMRSTTKHLKSTLALGKEPKNDSEHFLIHFSTTNKTGVKYRVNSTNIRQVFAKYLNEGKATIRFEDPPHDICIKCETLQLKCFMRVLKKCLTGETKELKLTNLCNISVTSKDIAPTKMVITDRSDFPQKGLPRTLETLHIKGIKMCNFRREILTLRHLSVLDLSNNEIEKLPAELGRMPSLKEVNMSNNQLGVHGEVDWRWLLGPQITKTLKFIDLSSNQLAEVPRSIWKLQGLVTLKLDNNMLSCLPPSIGQIRTLRFLTIASNQLKSLPCSLMQCKLEYLDLSTNQFQQNLEHTSVDINTFKPWDMYIGDLVRIAASAVLKNKLNYAPNTIPYTLVEFLDNFSFCICGFPVVDNSVNICKKFVLKDFFASVVFDNNRESDVCFDCYFCSSKCYRKVVR